MAHPVRIALLVAAAAPVAGGCADGAGPRAFDARCTKARPARPATAPAGLLAPAGTVLAASVRRGGATQVTGFLPFTPAQYLDRIEDHDGWRIYFKETERHEAEAIYTDGTHRNVWKVVTACPGGSRFSALVGAEPLHDVDDAP